MTLRDLNSAPVPRRRPLVEGLVLALAVPVCGALAAADRPAAPRSPAGATTWPIARCTDDGGADTLRGVIADAASGDTVDLTGLACSTITLEHGQIVVAQDDLTIVGPGATALVLSGNGASRVFSHTGAGTLSVTGLGFTAGVGPTDYGQGGGCLHANGHLRLEDVRIAGCSAGDGGAIHAAGDLTLEHVQVEDNTALYRGGGIFARTGTLTLTASTVSGNTAGYRGGGVFSQGDNVLVESSAIIENEATAYDAGLAHLPYDGSYQSAGNRFRLINSTISGNRADIGFGGGVQVNAPNVEVRNSTVAFNQARVGCPGLHSIGDVYGADVSVAIESSILSNNATSSGTPCDLIAQADSPITGSHNLIAAPSTTLPPVLPPDTLVGVDPRLWPLVDNGGATRTHGLNANSPAIDAGVNPLVLAHDQRGAGYARVYGAAPDIGAFEMQPLSAAPIVSKTFTPTSVPVNGLTTLRIMLVNADAAPSTLTAPLIDALPGTLRVANPPMAETTCTGGLVTVVPGADTVTLEQGSQIPAGGVCTISVSVIAHTAGTYTNLIPAGALQTDTGSNVAPATAELAVTGQATPPTVGKAFAPSTIGTGGTSRLTITLANIRPNPATLVADLVDTLPPPLVVADPPQATTTCPGGTLTAEPGTGAVRLHSGAQVPGGICTVSVMITADAAGQYFNTIPAGALQTDFGNSPDAAIAGLTVTGVSDRLFADDFEGDAP